MKYFLLLLAVFNSSVYCSTLKNITWLEVDYPPLYMNSKTYGLGIHNKIARYISSELKDKYTFTYISANTTRIETLLAQSTDNKIYCVPGSPVKNFEKALTSSTVLFRVPSVGLVVRKNETRTPDANKTYSLKKFGEQNGITGFVEKGNFPPEVMKAQSENPKYFYNINTTNPLAPIEMLVKNRIDAYIIYKLVYEYFIKTDGLNLKDEIKFINITEAGPSLDTFLACGKSNSTEKILSQFDEIIKTEKFKKFLLDILKEYNLAKY